MHIIPSQVVSTAILCTPVPPMVHCLSVRGCVFNAQTTRLRQKFLQYQPARTPTTHLKHVARKNIVTRHIDFCNRSTHGPAPCPPATAVSFPGDACAPSPASGPSAGWSSLFSATVLSAAAGVSSGGAAPVICTWVCRGEGGGDAL